MIRTILRLAVLCCLGSPCLATGFVPQRGVWIGPEIGITKASFHFADPENLSLSPDKYGSILGPQAGIRVLIQTGDVLGIQTGVDYVRKGYSVEAPLYEDYSDGCTLTYPTRLHYIAVPVLARVSKATGPVSSGVLLGPEFAYLVKAQSRVEGCGLSSGWDDNAIYGYPRFDFGLTAGLSIAFPTASVQQMFSIGYTWGISNLNDSENRDEHHIYNRTWVLSWSVLGRP